MARDEATVLPPGLKVTLISFDVYSFFNQCTPTSSSVFQSFPLKSTLGFLDILENQ